MVRLFSAASLCLLLFLCGCGSKPAEQNNGSKPESDSGGDTSSPQPFANLDLRRLGFPQGWRDFENDLQNATIQVGIEKKPLEEARLQSLLERARSLAKSDNCPHPHDIPKFADALVVCAQSYCLANDTEKAMALLEEASKIGLLDSQLLKSKAFDSIRDIEEFKNLKLTDLNELLAKFLIKKPYLSVQDLLAAKTEPSMPESAKMDGKILVIFTGLQLSPEATELLQESTEAGALAMAIVSNDLKASTPNISVHISGLKPDALMPDSTPMIWVSNGDGEVVSYIRMPTAKGIMKSIVTRLKADQS